MIRYAKFSVCTLLLALGLTACERQGSEKDDNGPATLQKMEFLLDWQPEPTYLGVYYARATGEFRKLGIDMTIVPSWGANQAVSAVSAGRYPIATASGGATVLAYNNGAEIVSLGVLYPRVPTVVYGLASRSVSAPKDLEGKRIGIYPGSITSNEFDAFVRANGIDRNSLRIVSLSGADIPLLLANQVDAVLHYTEMSPVLVNQNPEVPEVDGRRTFELMLKDHGVGGYGLNIVTSRPAFQRDSTRLRQIAAATVNGYRSGCQNPEAAVAAFVREFPDKEPAYVRESWRRVCQLVGTNIGTQDVRGWQETIDLYRQLGLLNVPVTPGQILSN
jgi:NitT/TauT family transport system substrate-binding protein